MQTDFDKLMDILKVEESDRISLFNGVVSGTVELVLDFHEDGSLSWGTLGDDWDDDVDETGFNPYMGCYDDDC